MREQLEKDIKKRFGATYGSKRIKSQLQEIIANALDRYDEEIRNGSSEKDAYRATMNSLGDLHTLHKSVSSRNHEHAAAPTWLSLIFGAIAIIWSVWQTITKNPFPLFPFGSLWINLALLAVIFGIIGIKRSNHWRYASQKGSVFALIGLFSGIVSFGILFVKLMIDML